MFGDILNAIAGVRNAIDSGFRLLEASLKPPELETWTFRFKLGEAKDWQPVADMVSVQQISMDLTDPRYRLVLHSDAWSRSYNAHAFRFAPVDVGGFLVTRSHMMQCIVEPDGVVEMPLAPDVDVTLVIRGRSAMVNTCPSPLAPVGIAGPRRIFP
jgi:hypothetical protein